MPSKGFWSGILIVLLFSITACSSVPKKDYIQPDDPEIDECVSQCNVVKVQCRDRARESYDWCTRDYQYKRAEHQRCVASKGVFCIAPRACPGLEIKGCVVQYDDCFEGCGGTIRERQEVERQEGEPDNNE